MTDLPKSILDSLPDPVILLDAGRVVVRANRAARELLDVDMEEKDLALSLRHPAVLDAVDEVLDGLPERTAEVSLPVPVPRDFNLHVAAVDGGGAAGGADAESAVRAVLVLNDMTAAKRAEQMRADFVANASHELRSPLTALVGFIETLKGAASDDAEARARFLDVMHLEASRMARLIDDLLTLSRVEINEHVRPRDSVDLGQILGNVAESLAPRAAERDVTIRIEGTKGLSSVVGDRDQLVQVFHNLVENAIKYGDTGATVEISAKRVARIPDSGEAGIAVAVSDQGAGIPNYALPRLTERFYRIDEAHSQEDADAMSSTGLGLAIVKHIVSRHRGRLQVESEIGKGSTFSVFLPV